MSQTPSDSTAIVWLRRDFRLHDHAALCAAAANHTHLVLVYVHAPEEEAPWTPGAANAWWRARSLDDLCAQLKALGHVLCLRAGSTVDQLLDIARTVHAKDVYAHVLYEPQLRAQADQVAHVLQQHHITLHMHQRAFLCDPLLIAPSSKQGYTVFTPYWRRAQTMIGPVVVSGVPQWQSLGTPPSSLTLAQLAIAPQHSWVDKLSNHWTPGERAAREALDLFVEAVLPSYDSMRDIPAKQGTSLLSAALHFGELSPHTVWDAVWQAQHDKRNKIPQAAAQAFVRQLGWREFATHVLAHQPHTPLQPLRTGAVPHAVAAASAHPHWQAWTKGQTGFPLCDAGMRQLWQTGWMHNRVRMLTAGVWCKQLGGAWQDGARWFWDTLVDADLANNTFGWQWSAGCGADAAPYFRILSPTRQQERFDPKRVYIKRWCPTPQPVVLDERQARLHALARHRSTKHK